MKLPIDNCTENPLTLMVEPETDQYLIPAGAKAILTIDLHEAYGIAVFEGHITLRSKSLDATEFEIVPGD